VVVNLASIKQRILWLNWRDIRNPDAGGAEVFTHEVAKRLVRLGWSVTLFTSAFSHAKPEDEIDGVEIIRKGGRFGVYRKARDYCGKYEEDFDIIIDEINTRPFMTPRFVRARPIIALIHQLAREYWFYETPWPVSWVGYFYLERSWLSTYRRTRTVTVSESTKKDLIQWGFTDVHVVPEGLSVPVASEVPKKEPTPTLLFVGRLKRVKKPDHAIRAYRLVRETIPNARLWILGDGYMRKGLERIAGDGVTLKGRVEDSMKIELMTRAHVLVFPAVREGWGLSITESNARGTPAVAYDVPGVRDAISNGDTGLLVARDNWKALGEAACRLLRDQHLREEMAAKALKFASKFSWDKTCTQFAKICESALNPNYQLPRADY